MSENINNEFFIMTFPVKIISGEVVEIRGEVYRKDSLKCYIPSNERGNHYKPHVHVIFNNEDYEVTIGNMIEVIKPNKCRMSYKNHIIKSVGLNLKICRQKWNEISSFVKFSEEDFKISTIRYFDGKGCCIKE